MVVAKLIEEIALKESNEIKEFV